MTIPLRMVHAKATPAGEQPCAAPIRAKRWIAQQGTVRAAEWRISHYWYCVLRTPWQQVMFNGAVTETVRNLICGAGMAVRNVQKPLHVADIEIGDAPGPNLSLRTQVLKSRYHARKVGNPIWPMQQVKVEIVSPNASEAPLTGPLNSVPCHMSRPDLRHQEYVFASTRNDISDQFLRIAISIYLGRIDQRHAERDTFAQRFLLNRFRMSSLAQTRRTLTERWHHGSVVEFHGSLRPVWSRATGRSRCSCSRASYCYDGRHSQAECQQASS